MTWTWSITGQFSSGNSQPVFAVDRKPPHPFGTRPNFATLVGKKKYFRRKNCYHILSGSFCVYFRPHHSGWSRSRIKVIFFKTITHFLSRVANCLQNVKWLTSNQDKLNLPEREAHIRKLHTLWTWVNGRTFGYLKALINFPPKMNMPRSSILVLGETVICVGNHFHIKKYMIFFNPFAV